MKITATALISIMLLAAGTEGFSADQWEEPADTVGVAGEDSLQSETGADRSLERQWEDPVRARRRFVPVWTVNSTADESSFVLGSGMQTSIVVPQGWRGSTRLSVSKRVFRGRDMQSINQSLTNTMSKNVQDRYSTTFTLGKTYSRRKAVGLARKGGALVVENEYAEGNFSLFQKLPLAQNTQFSMSGKGSRGMNDFKYDRLLQGSASAHMWRQLFDRLTFAGGYGLDRMKETSEIGARVFGGMPSESDTLQARLRYAGSYGSHSLIYRRMTGVLRKVDPPRGNSLEVIDNPDLAQREESRQKSETITFTSRIKPLQRLDMDFKFDRRYSDQRNKVDERLSRETENLLLSAKASYRYLPSGSVNFELERGLNDIDYGPVSLSSYKEERRVLRFTLSQGLGKTLTTSLNGSTSLQQRYFKKKDANPRDVDFLLHSLTANMEKRIPGGISAGARFSYRRYETINMDETLSGDNRTDYTYWVVPRISLRPGAWITLSQEYEIKMEFADFTFKENENYLNRTTILNTAARMRFYTTLGVSIRHRYRFTDTGSYLRPAGGGERLYGRTNESFENRLDFNVDYEPVQALKFSATSNYRFQESNRLARRDGSLVVIHSSTYDSGEMSLGVERLTSLSDRGQIDLGFTWVRRFGPNLTPERRKFWKVNINTAIRF